MAYTYEELKDKTVQELREIAKQSDHESLKGAMQMNKEHLLPTLCHALGIDMHEHHVVRGIDKPAIKAKMRELRKRRDEAISTQNAPELKSIRRQLHHLNRQIRGHLA